MKKIIIVVFVVILLCALFVGCAKEETQYQDLKAIIVEANEHSLLVQPIEGMTNIDILYLNFNDDTDITENAPLEPGTIVYARVGVDIMESYPPQVFLYEITKTEIDPNIIVKPTTDDTSLMPDEYIIGEVIEISGDEYRIEVQSANLFDGEITLKISQSVIDADMPIEPGYLIGVYVTIVEGDLITAEKIVFSETA